MKKEEIGSLIDGIILFLKKRVDEAIGEKQKNTRQLLSAIRIVQIASSSVKMLIKFMG